MSIEVCTTYTLQGGFSLDEAAAQAAGRQADFSGAGFGQRDLGWTCKSDFEAQRIKRALEKIGLRASIRGDNP